MKNITSLVGAILFSTLFYNQEIGMNLSLFTILVILMLMISNRSEFNNNNTIIISIAYLMSGITVYLYQSNLSIITNIVASMTLIGSVSENRASIYVKWLNGLYTTIASFFAIKYDSLSKEVKNIEKKEINYIYWMKIIGIPTVVLILFINLYRNGNSVFDDMISKIDFTFINLEWILMTAFGYYLCYNILHPVQVEPATEIDINTGNVLIENKSALRSKEDLRTEKQLGVVLIALLNLLIVFFLITDVYTLLNINQFGATELSNYVHNGVNALIASILLAIIIIVYFFRGSLNFYKQSIPLKRLAYLWILLNIVLVVLTTIKNYEYIHSYGFTYKRIGVLIYLFLTLIGLITTFVKVNSIKNIWYLFRMNSQIAFIILIVAATINWDKRITFYNINYADKTDVEYLLKLSNNNTMMLKDYLDDKALNSAYSSRIEKKYIDYIDILNENSWQESIFDNYKK